MLAQVCNLEVGDLIITIGDAHIYNNHFEQVNEQLTRDPLPLARLELNSEISVITDFEMEDIELADYQSHDAIKAPMAV
jgi:thymidylate synthase